MSAQAIPGAMVYRDVCGCIHVGQPTILGVELLFEYTCEDRRELEAHLADYARRLAHQPATEGRIGLAPESARDLLQAGALLLGKDLLAAGRLAVGYAREHVVHLIGLLGSFGR